jgi:hypothetical protein
MPNLAINMLSHINTLRYLALSNLLFEKTTMLFVFLATSVQSALAKDNNISNSCNADMEWYTACTVRMESVDGCSSAIVNFTNTPSSQCSGINFLWAQPADNLTMILETPFTKTLIIIIAQPVCF